MTLFFSTEFLTGLMHSVHIFLMTGTIDIRPLSDVVGAIVEGVDLTCPLDDTTADLLRDTFSRHSILCIRGQQLAASDQIRFGDLFGPWIRVPGPLRLWRAGD